MESNGATIYIDWSKLDLQENASVEAPLEKEKIARSEIEMQSEQEPNRSNSMMAVLKTGAAVYAFGRQGGQMAVNSLATDYTIQGETLKAERMQTQFSNTANNVALGLGVTMSLATGNPLVVAMTAYGLAQKAFNLANETKKYQAQLAVERNRSQYYQNRLIKDISEVR